VVNCGAAIRREPSGISSPTARTRPHRTRYAGSSAAAHRRGGACTRRLFDEQVCCRGVIEIEDGAYPPSTTRGISLTYHQAGVVRAWSTDNTTEAPSALNRAVVAVYAALGTSVPE